MKQPPTRPRYIGQWRPRDEAHWYSTITLNGVEHKIPDGIGAQDGEDVLRLLPNVEGNPDLIGLVKNGDMLAYVRDPLRKSLNLFPLPNEKDAFDIIKGRTSHAELGYSEDDGRPKQISLWYEHDPCPYDRPLHIPFERPFRTDRTGGDIAIYRVSLRGYGIDEQREEQLKAEVLHWKEILRPARFPKETMNTDPVDFTTIAALRSIAEKCIKHPYGDQTPPLPFMLNCIQWVTMVFSLAVCFPLSHKMLRDNGWFDDYQRNWGGHVKLAPNDTLTGLDELPIPFYSIRDVISDALNFYLPDEKAQISALLNQGNIAARMGAHGETADQRFTMPSAFMLENRLRAAGIKRKTESVFEYVATVVAPEKLVKVDQQQESVQ